MKSSQILRFRENLFIVSAEMSVEFLILINEAFRVFFEVKGFF